MRVVADLVRNLAGQEARRPFRFEFSSQQFKRREAFEWSVAPAAIQQAGLALGEFGGDGARERRAIAATERLQGRAFGGGEAEVGSLATGGPIRRQATGGPPFRGELSERSCLCFVLQLQDMTVQTAGALNQLAALLHR